MASTLLNESTIADVICGTYCRLGTTPIGLSPQLCASICHPFCNLPFLPPLPSFQVPSGVITNNLDYDSLDFKEDHQDLLFDTFFVVAIVIAFSILLSCAIRKCRQAREESSSSNLQRQQQQQGPAPHRPPAQVPEIANPMWFGRAVGLQPSVIEAITVCKYNKGGGAAGVTFSDGTVCAVCLNNFQEDETLRLLPKCNHAFHIECIDTWLNSHNNCPICRADIVLPPPTGFPSTPHQNVGVEGSDHSGTVRESQRGGGRQEDDSTELTRTEQEASSIKTPART